MLSVGVAVEPTHPAQSPPLLRAPLSLLCLLPRGVLCHTSGSAEVRREAEGCSACLGRRGGPRALPGCSHKELSGFGCTGPSLLLRGEEGTRDRNVGFPRLISQFREGRTRPPGLGLDSGSTEQTWPSLTAPHQDQPRAALAFHERDS